MKICDWVRQHAIPVHFQFFSSDLGSLDQESGLLAGWLGRGSSINVQYLFIGFDCFGDDAVQHASRVGG